MKTATKVIALLMSICIGAFASLAEITTGWKSPLTSTTYTWSDTANWVDGDINGIFSEGLVGSGKTNPKIVFSADATLSGGLTLAYTNVEQSLTFRGDGTDRTLTLGGPLVMNLANATKGSVVFGSKTAGEGLSLHFTCSPEFQIDYGPWPEVFQPISGEGEALVTGSRDSAIFLALHGDAADFSGGVFVSPNKGLYFNSGDQNAQGAIRATSVRIYRADILVKGNSGAAAVDSISGSLVLGGGGMAQFAHYYNAGFKNHTLRVGSLVAEPGAILDIHSPSLVLGATEFESGNNFVVDSGVATIGTGATGTVFAPVVPWARASGGNSKNWETADNLFGYFVLYDATRGFRILNRDTEQEHYEAGYVGPVTNQNANVYVGLANGIVEFTGDNVVNSLQFSSSGNGATVRATNDTLTVSSGCIDMTGSDNITLNANLVFGNVPAYITYRGDKTGYLKGSVSGSAGITFQSMAQVVEKNSGIYVEAKGTYNGTTYVNSRLFISTPDFLPHGERQGDVVVNGILQTFTAGPVTMNGLFGNGSLRHGQSYATSFVVGDNNADGDFTGNIDRANGKVSFTKNGSGTQRLAGHCTHNEATTVSGGTLIVDGDFTASSVDVKYGAALGGSGGITNDVTFADGAKLAVTVANDVASCLTVAGTVSGGPVTVDAKIKSGTWRTAQCVLKSDAAIEASFVKGAGIAALERRNNDTELWATPKTSAFCIVIR